MKGQKIKFNSGGQEREGKIKATWSRGEAYGNSQMAMVKEKKTGNAFIIPYRVIVRFLGVVFIIIKIIFNHLNIDT